MTISFTGQFDFDYDKEAARIEKCFSGDEKSRQLELLNAFWIGKDPNKAIELYNALPYSDKDECPEQEFVGCWFNSIVENLLNCHFRVSSIVIDNPTKIAENTK